jgi:Flp pilus assembly protein TadD
MDDRAPRPEEIRRLNEAVARQAPAGLDERSGPAFVAAARSALVVGRADDAVVLGRAALALNPADPRAWAVVGEGLFADGRVADARVAFEEALALDDKDFVTAVACARAQAATGASSSAQALLTFVLTRTTSRDLRAEAAALLATLGGEHPSTSRPGGAP